MKYLLLIMLAGFLFACQSKTSKRSSANTNQKTLIGGNKDSHGCLTSAGYTWSELKQDCIRLFESGIRLNPVENEKSYTTSAFLIFAKDSNQVEVFIPDSSHSTILSHKATLYESPESNIIVQKTDTLWKLSINGRIRYQSY